MSPHGQHACKPRGCATCMGSVGKLSTPLCFLLPEQPVSAAPQLPLATALPHPLPHPHLLFLYIFWVIVFFLVILFLQKTREGAWMREGAEEVVISKSQSNPSPCIFGNNSCFFIEEASPMRMTNLCR